MSSAGLDSVIDDDITELGSLLEGLGAAFSKTRAQERYKGTGFHILHNAASNGRITQIKALLARGAQVDVRESDGWTPLMLAAQNGHVEAVRELLDNKADVNARGNDGVTATYQAAVNGKGDVVELLVAYGANATLEPIDRFSPMLAAVYRGVMSKLTKDDKASPESVTHILRVLARAGANVNSVDGDGDTALHLSCLHGDVEWVKTLLDANADVNAVNGKGRTPLSNAAYESNVEMVRLLLRNGARTEIAEGDQWTPLHFAAQFLTKTTLQTIRLLVEAGADVNSRIKSNATALHLAAQKGDLNILQYLIDKGGLVDAQTNQGRTPLFQAVANGHVEAVDLLARAGANVNVLENKGLRCRPLHFAAVKGQKAMVERLLDLGADIDATTGSEGQTALKLSSVRGSDECDEIFMLLLDRGAKAD
jgi:ankyrin repeat protein